MNNIDGNAPELNSVAHPLVLRGAWLRVDAWYRSGNLAPQPELARWRLYPEAELRALASELRAGRWKPEPWRQLPYPKKGARLRHYVLPTVRDQVAFMAHMVLLGPFIDNATLNFVFGNRWYRPISWDRRRSKPCWVRRPYPLLSHKSYLPYARSHGLYRRVAHWTVARMTDASVDREDYGGRIEHPDDYDQASLPDWIQAKWWPGDAPRRVCWATLDVQLAYPSVQLEHLRLSLLQMLEQPATEGMLGGYPRSIITSLAQNHIRRRIANRVVDALQAARVSNEDIPRDAWRPFHAMPLLPPEKDQGLPTGLAISGILLNAALHRSDDAVLRYLKSLSGDRRGAVLRFADDMMLLSWSARGVMDLIEVVWRGIAGDEGARLDVPHAPSNLYLNLGKIGPDSIGDSVFRFLSSQGWEECHACREICPPRKPYPRRTLGTWWAVHERETGFADLRDKVERSTIGPRELGPFVTTLVARLSDIGRDTLSERFGEGARIRLARLHELARFDIDDQQVRPDTRRTFAVNRMVRAWLPLEGDVARTALKDIRDSVAHVLRITPWKFALWGAVVRAAARRPAVDDVKESDTEARGWLLTQLRRVAHTPDARESVSWFRSWPEPDNTVERHGRDPLWRALYLSFHRTAFWHALAGMLRELWRHHDHVHRSLPGDAEPSPRWWTVRAVPAGLHEHVARFLGDTDHWVDVLYPTDQPPDFNAWSWELDQFVEAVLASVPRCELAESWRRAERAGESLMVPGALEQPSRAPKTMAILERFGRVCVRRERARALDMTALAHVSLGGSDRHLGSFLFPPDRSPRLLGARRFPEQAVAVGVSLGCSESIGRELVAGIPQAASEAANLVRRDPLAFWEYIRGRRLLLGHDLGG